MSMAILISSWV